MKNNYFNFVFFLIILFFPLPSVLSQNISWQKTYGGLDGDYLTAIDKTGDGGFILGGRSSSEISGNKTEASNGKQDIWVVKNDASGNIQWQTVIGGSGGDFLNSISQTTDGGYILGGYSNSSASGSKTENQIGCMDFWVIKLAENGVVIWQKTFGGSSADAISKVIQTQDGGYLVGGSSKSNSYGLKTENSYGGWDYYILKLDNHGEILWQKTIGGEADDKLSDLSQTHDGGYILGGYSNSTISGLKTENSQGNFDYWILKINNRGNIEWQQTIGGDADDRLVSVMQTQEGGYVLAGNSTSNASGNKTKELLGRNDFWVLKLNDVGNIVWQNVLGGLEKDGLTSVCQTTDAGYILGGYTSSDKSESKTEDSYGSNDYWIVKMKPNGTLDWQKTMGGTDEDRLTAVIQTQNEGVLCAGYSRSLTSGNKTVSTNGLWDYWVVKLDNLLNGTNNELYADNIVLYPSPTATNLTIANYSDSSLKTAYIFDSNRKLMKKIDLSEMGIEKTIDVATFAVGVYIVEITGNRNSVVKRFIKN
jgi:hypothetical protein